MYDVHYDVKIAYVTIFIEMLIAYIVYVFGDSCVQCFMQYARANVWPLECTESADFFM